MIEYEEAIKVTEHFVQYIWRFRLFHQGKVFDRSGRPLNIIHPGILNTNSGPDFFLSKIRSGNEKVIGNVEIHVCEDDWYRHKHHCDAAYNNVILHVVWEPGKRRAVTQSGYEIPTLYIKDMVYQHTLKKYAQLLHKQKAFVPCSGMIQHIDKDLVQTFYGTLVTNRLQRKVQGIKQVLHETNNDFDHSMWIYIGKYIGGPVNQDLFEQLLKGISFSVLLKCSESMLKTEALLYGQAGFLHEEREDAYFQSLQKEYQYLSKLYRLDTVIKKHAWKFSRMYPSGFPTLRIAQLAALIYTHRRAFTRWIHAEDQTKYNLFFKVKPSEYWKTHFHFGKRANKTPGTISHAVRDRMVINVLIPLMYTYGQMYHKEEYMNKAVQMLESVKQEENAIVQKWRKLDVPIQSAYSTQALLELKNEYCDQLACLSCQIGYQLMKFEHVQLK